jgi:hypothetical protein
MANFEFKSKTWTNNKLTPSYSPPAPVAVGTDCYSSSGGGIPLQAARGAISPLASGIDPEAVGIAPGAGGTNARWNQPYIECYDRYYITHDPLL